MTRNEVQLEVQLAVQFELELELKSKLQHSLLPMITYDCNKTIARMTKVQFLIALNQTAE